MKYKNEEDFRKELIEIFKQINIVRNVYKLENYSGRGLPDILVITNTSNFLIECKIENQKTTKIQDYNIQSNKYCFLCRYKNNIYNITKGGITYIKDNQENLIDFLLKFII